MDQNREEPIVPAAAGPDLDGDQVIGPDPHVLPPGGGPAGSGSQSDLSHGQPVGALAEAAAGSVVIARPLGPTPVAPRPWGFWATLGWSMTVMGLLLLVQVVVVVGAIVAAKTRNPGLDIRSLNLESNGLLLSIATIVSAPVGVGLILLLIRIRRYPISQYLALKCPSMATASKWAILLLVFAASCDGFYWLVNRSIVPPFMVEAYKTAGSLPLLVFTLLVAAPVLEEILFRGFMFHGIACSRLGAFPAVLITAAAWAVIHVQYDWVGMAAIFLGGILMGIARLKARSVILTMLLHALQNLLATIEVVVYMRMTA